MTWYSFFSQLLGIRKTTLDKFGEFTNRLYRVFFYRYHHISFVIRLYDPGYIPNFSYLSDVSQSLCVIKVGNAFCTYYNVKLM